MGRSAGGGVEAGQFGQDGRPVGQQTIIMMEGRVQGQRGPTGQAFQPFMLQAAIGNGWLDPKRAVLEALTGIKRAGADCIITYFAEKVLDWL